MSVNESDLDYCEVCERVVPEARSTTRKSTAQSEEKLSGKRLRAGNRKTCPNVRGFGPEKWRKPERGDVNVLQRRTKDDVMKTKGVLNVWFMDRNYGFIHEEKGGVVLKHFLHASNVVAGTPRTGATVVFKSVVGSKASLRLMRRSLTRKARKGAQIPRWAHERLHYAASRSVRDCESILAQGFTKDTAVAATQALYAADVSPKDAKEFLNSYQQPAVVPVADKRFQQYTNYLTAIFRPGDTLCFVGIEHGKTKNDDKIENEFVSFEKALLATT